MAAAKQAVRAKITVQNIKSPPHITQVDALKYEAMKLAMLKSLPAKLPGLSQAEMKAALLPHLSEKEFPCGEKAGWWMKCVQLDMEAKKLIVRDATAKPLRWYRLK